MNAGRATALGSALAALLLAAPACSDGPAPDQALRALETRRPDPVQRPTVTPRPATWDETRAVRDWPTLRATYRTADGGSLRLVRGPGLVELQRPDGTRWRWRRNPIDPRRVDAEAHHPSAAVRLAHDHSTLLAEGLTASWDEAACLGLDPLRIARFERLPGEPLRAFGQAFVRRRPADTEQTADLAELSWSEELGLPLALWTPPGPDEPDAVPALQLIELSAVGSTPDPPLPEALAALPRVDLADWREEQHDG